MRELHLFAGAGGGILGGMMLGHTPVAAVEIDPYCRAVLQERQNDGHLPTFPIYTDVREFDGKPWRGRVDVIAGGFPCQDLSVAGKGRGLDGERSGLWWEMHRIIREVGPRYVFVENVPAISTRGLDQVLGSLADLGFDAEWGVLSAADVGAPHLRKRWWCLAADSNRSGCAQQRGAIADQTQRDAAKRGCAAHPDADCRRCEKQRDAKQPEQQRELGHKSDGLCARGRRRRPTADDAGHTEAQPGLGGAADGLAAWLDGAGHLQANAWSEGWEADCPRVVHGKPKLRTKRLQALGNGQVPQCAAWAWRTLWDRLHSIS